MALPQSSIKSGLGPSHVEDPYDWSPDQVVHWICSPDSPVMGSNGSLLLSDADGFAGTLRDEGIDGEALLTLVTIDILRHAWGLKYGVCAKILNSITRLQQQSLKYQEFRRGTIMNDQCLRESGARTSHRSTPFTTSPEHRYLNFQSPSSHLAYNSFQGNHVNEQRPVCQLPTQVAADTHEIVYVPKETRQAFIEEESGIMGPPAGQAQNETTFIDANGKRRRRLILGPSIVAQSSNGMDPFVPTEKNASHEITCGEVTGLNDPAFERRDQLLSPASTQAGFSDPVESSKDSNNDVTTSTNAVIETGQNNRKRIQPTLVAQYDESDIHDGMAIQLPESISSTSKDREEQLSRSYSVDKRAKRTVDQIHYGPSAINVDDIFYGGTVLGAVLEADTQSLTAEDQELCFNSIHQQSDAQCLWVNSRMKYFFRSTTSDILVREGGQEVGIIPYPDRLGKRNRPLSMTVLSRCSNRILTRRANRLDWATSTAPPNTDMKLNAPEPFKVQEPLMAVDEDSSDWDVLWKWDHRDDNEILPLYGDSGSEGEYDLETWREMEAERGMIVRPEGRSESQKLPLAEVEVAIDIAIQQLRDEWHVGQYPKIQHKARRYWVKARRDSTLVVQINALEQRVKDLDVRLLGLRKEICEEAWTKIDQVHKQSKSMQLSVFEQEECQWKKAIIQSKKAPEKVPVIRNTAHKATTDMPPLQDGEEDLDSNASTAVDDETDDDLDEFIVDDDSAGGNDPIMHWEEDTTMADVEDTIELDTVRISPSDLLLPKAKEKESCRVHPRVEKQPQPRPTAAPNFIDLTQASSSPSSTSPKAEPARIVTPPVIQSEEDSEAWFQRSRGKKPEFKHPPNLNNDSFINLDTDSDCQISAKSSTDLPSLHEVKRIRNLSPTMLVEKQDRKRLLVWLIAHTDDGKREQVIAYLKSQDMAGCFSQVQAGLKKMKAGKYVLPGKTKRASDCILQVAAWYVGWTIPVKLDAQGVSIPHIRITLDDNEGFELFYDFMLESLDCYEQPSSTPTKRKAGKTRVQHVVSEQSDSSSSIANPRVFAAESQGTLQKRDAALQRMREDNQRAQLQAQKRARQKELLPRFSAMATLRAEQIEEAEVTLNPGKLDEQDFIRLDPSFGRGAQLKPHQKEGLQFMWREITGDHKDLQGCLLAQTMGLGKTVQVIALLVALSDVAHSSSQNIRDQVPAKLRTSQTLILCPPGLIENWWDEFLLWPSESNHLGEIRKVSAVMKLEERISEILVWNREGGVLLMGYFTFKDLLQNKPRTPKGHKAAASTMSAPLADDLHQSIKAALLEKPNLVVADEAHVFKSQHSNISQVINKIKCKSRIALTGSPLSNNLGEYFSMIDWIAPEYLGSYSDFKEVYERPIQEGLYQDQGPALYRESRKRLKALEWELEPKIHRADPSALHNSLNGKSEFVVRVPLTAFQAQLYRDFVSNVGAVAGKINVKIREAKLWSYLSMLQLLCNHPGIFYNKLVAEQNECKQVRKPGLLPGQGCEEQVQNQQNGFEKDTSSELVRNDALPTGTLSGLTMEVDESGPLPGDVRAAALHETQQVVHELGEAVDTLHLSNKMQAVMTIIELSNNAGDKVLVFSHRLHTLDFIGTYLKDKGRTFSRIDGLTPPQRRQEVTKSFNEGSDPICLISTRAGGQGLNMFGANRVIILDSHFNPMWEQQAVGRAYRIGQKKHVYVYRLTVAGTFEEEMHDQALFKEQLVTRVLEKKNPHRVGLKGAKQYLFPPKEVENSNIEMYLGKDPAVLDHLLKDQDRTPIVSITPSETFHVDDGLDLTAQEQKEVEQMLKDEKLRRRDPARYQALVMQRLRLPVQNAPTLSQPNHQSSMYGRPSFEDVLSVTAPIQSINGHIRDVETTPQTSPFFGTSLQNILSAAVPAQSINGHIHDIETNPQPSISGDPSLANILSAPAPAQSINDHIHDVETRLVSSIAGLFPSGALDITRRKRASRALRSETKLKIFDLVAQKDVPHPKNTAGMMRLLISQNATDEKDYIRLWHGIRQLLEVPDVNPDTLLKVMTDKLGEPRQAEPKGQTTRSESICTETTAPLEAEHIDHLHPSTGHTPQPAQLAVKLQVEPGRVAGSILGPPSPSQNEGTKRARSEIDTERPHKQQKIASADAPNPFWTERISKSKNSWTEKMEGQFQKLLDTEKLRPK